MPGDVCPLLEGPRKCLLYKKGKQLMGVEDRSLLQKSQLKLPSMGPEIRDNAYVPPYSLCSTPVPETLTLFAQEQCEGHI